MLTIIHEHDVVAFARQLLGFEPDAAQAKLIATKCRPGDFELPAAMGKVVDGGDPR